MEIKGRNGGLAVGTCFFYFPADLLSEFLTGIMLRITFIFLLLLAVSSTSGAQGIITTLPDEIDASASWVFFLPDEIVTPDNPVPSHPELGDYEYAEIANQFLAGGFTVITRPRETSEHPYLVAGEIIEQIRTLLDAGVPASRIGLVGARQGAAIAVLVTTKLPLPDMQVVLLSLCTDVFIDFWIQQNELLAGNVLSMYASGNDDRVSCLRYIEHSRPHGVAQYREIVFPASEGQGFHFKPRAEWMLPAIAWLRGEHERVTEDGLLPPEVKRPPK
jgi:hypothetical protein